MVSFAIFWFWSQSRDIVEYLPPNPSASGVSVTSSYAKVFRNFAIRHFRFTSKDSADPAEAARLFEAQLADAGWERMDGCSNGRVASEVWRHRQKLGGNLFMAFTVVRLNEATHEFFGSIVTEPYWPHIRE